MDMWIKKFGQLSYLVIICLFVSRCHGDEFKVLAHPQDALLAPSANVVLECKFNMIVRKCTWYEDFFKEVSVNSYNSWADKTRNGTNTKDCTLKISTFSRSVDATCYYCVGSGATSANSALATRKACLSVIPNDIPNYSNILANPDNATVQEGASVVLTCKSKIPALSCAWIRSDRKEPFLIMGRYEFLNYGGRLTKDNADCSIRINQFKAIDAVHWMCYVQIAVGTSIELIKSNWAKLTFVPMPPSTTVAPTTEYTTAPPTSENAAPTTESTTVIITTESPTTKMDQTTTGLPESSTTNAPTQIAQAQTGLPSTLVIMGTITLILLLVVICFQAAIIYVMKYKIQEYHVEAINLPRIEKQNLLE